MHFWINSYSIDEGTAVPNHLDFCKINFAPQKTLNFELILSGTAHCDLAFFGFEPLSFISSISNVLPSHYVIVIVNLQVLPALALLIHHQDLNVRFILCIL